MLVVGFFKVEIKENIRYNVGTANTNIAQQLPNVIES